MELGSSRHTLEPAPPATAKENSLSFDEVSKLWDELTARHLTIINLEIYLSNTTDRELIHLLERALHKLATPQLEQLETILKEDGFTVPPRPISRAAQGPPGQVNKIKIDDNEVLNILATAGQIAIEQHVRAYASAIRKDVMKLFKGFISTEIEEYQKLIQLATERRSLNNPPVVTSRHG